MNNEVYAISLTSSENIDGDIMYHVKLMDIEVNAWTMSDALYRLALLLGERYEL